MSPDLYDSAREDAGVKRHLDVMQRVVGYAPPTCPWRAMYHPLVREVMQALEHEESGNLALSIGVEPPAILMDAIGEFKRSHAAVRAEDEKLRAEKAKADRAHRQA